MRSMIAAIALLAGSAAFAGPAAPSPKVMVIGGEAVSPYQLQKLFHVDSPEARSANGEALHRDGYWNLHVAGVVGGQDLDVAVDTEKLPNCGTGIALYAPAQGASVKAQLSSGFLDNGNLIGFLDAASKLLVINVNKDGIGLYTGEVIDTTNNKHFKASLSFGSRSDGFDVQDVNVALSGTPISGYHKDLASSVAPGSRIAHAGLDSAQVCYKANTISTFSSELAPVIAMTYSAAATDGGADNMFVIGITDQAQTQGTPKVISSAITTAKFGIGVDVFE